ncbi:MAG: hypothetical protein LWW93_14585 [Hyphomicrobiales bacterium]|nr:hypothetical protein [Hyphomicrobiales bacterium]
MARDFALAFFTLLILGPATASEKPSFDCATAATARELAVCALPSLAGADRALAAAWRAARARLAPTDAEALRADQRAFVARIDQGFDAWLWGKQETPDLAGRRAAARKVVDGSEPAEALREQMALRTLLLDAIDPRPGGFVGLFVDQEGFVDIGPAADGRHPVALSIGTYGWPKYHCDFDASFRPIGGRLVAEEVANPEADRRVTHVELALDGARLRITEETSETSADPDVGRACPRISPLVAPFFRVDAKKLPADIRARMRRADM